MPRFILLLLPFFIACASDDVVCEQAIDARTACMDQAGVDYDENQTDQAKTVCSALLFAKPELHGFMDCQRVIFEAADCTDPLAAKAAVDASEACEQPI